MKSYSMLVERCNRQPRHIIPSEKHWYRNYKLAELVNNHLISHKYPQS